MIRYNTVYSLSDLMRVCEDLNFPYFSKENIRLFKTKASDFVPTLIEVNEQNLDQYQEIHLGYYIELVKVSMLNLHKYYQVKKVVLSKDNDKPYIWFSTLHVSFKTKNQAVQYAKGLLS